MKNYYCTLCGYRYIAASGPEESEGTVFGNRKHRLPAGLLPDRSDFGMLSEAWRCPRCGALKRFFRPESDRSARGGGSPDRGRKGEGGFPS